ncbi:MAG: sialate O-acetylesterase [Bacteroidales bacterium]|nr:sialate O-acetylesterase [Bacteroidales bacterium]
MTRKTLAVLLVASLLLNVVFIGRKVFFILKNKSKIVLSDKNNSGLYKEIFNICPNDSNDIIFLGNSITSTFPVVEFLPRYPLKNRGIWGNTTQDVLGRLDEITDGRPEKVFIMIGINDLVNGVFKNKLIENYKLILNKINKQSPETKIYIQSILPVSKHASFHFTGNYLLLNEDVAEVNDALKVIAEKRGFIYIDLFIGFITDGELNPEYSWDGLHINAKGYKLWFEQIRSFIVEPNY